MTKMNFFKHQDALQELDRQEHRGEINLETSFERYADLQEARKNELARWDNKFGKIVTALIDPDRDENTRGKRTLLMTTDKARQEKIRLLDKNFNVGEASHEDLVERSRLMKYDYLIEYYEEQKRQREKIASMRLNLNLIAMMKEDSLDNVTDVPKIDQSPIAANIIAQTDFADDDMRARAIACVNNLHDIEQRPVQDLNFDEKRAYSAYQIAMTSMTTDGIPLKDEPPKNIIRTILALQNL